MDTEDSNLLFDSGQISARLDLLFAKYLQAALASQSQVSSSGDPRVDYANMNLAALKAAVADLVAQNNRVLWRNVQRIFGKTSEG